MERVFNIHNFKFQNYENNKNNDNSLVNSRINLATDQSYWVLQLMRYAGFLPYRERNNQFSFHLWDISFWYAVSIYLTVTYYVVKITENNINSFNDEDCEFICQAFYLVIFILSLQTISVPICFWKQMNGIVDYFSLWYYFQQIYIQNSGKELRIAVESLTKKLTYSIILVTISICAIICCCVITSELTFEIIILYFVICFFVNVEIFFWFIQCLLIRLAAEKMQNFLQQMIESTNGKSQNVISICYEMWIALSNIMKSLADNFSFLTSLLCFSMFLSSLITIYCLFSQIFITGFYHFNVNFGILYFILSVWTASLQYILNDSSYRLTKQVDFRNWIITLNLNRMNENTQNQILELLSFFENQMPRIGLFGFEFLSRKFLITISSTLITYVIIILQFRNSGAHPSTTTSSKSNCSNITK